jgi:DeoR family glycerol-3-phosphate regulon repressor
MKTGSKRIQRSDAGLDAQGRVTDRMPAAVRQARIAQAFGSKGYVGVASLAEELGVSTMTIRRDILVLEGSHILKRTHGGAISVDLLPRGVAPQPEPPFAERAANQTAEKRVIAAAAARLVQPGEAIALDVGTSALLLAHELSGRDDLSLVTNNLSAASVLGSAGSNVYVLGGKIRWPELSIVGAETVAGAEARYTDRAFLGISGLDESGCFDYSPEDTLVKQAYARNTAHVTLLCDSSKFGKRAMAKVLDLAQVDCVITDALPPEPLATSLRAAGLEIIVAQMPTET